MAVDYTSPSGQVRLLINDTQVGTPVFSNDEIDAFLALEGDSVKLAAAQALDVIADDELLTSKVIRSQDVATDGASVADSLRARARALRDSVRETAAGGTALAPRGSFPDAPDDRPWR